MKMNENDENVDPMRDAGPDVELLRLEISENGEVFYHIDGVTKVPTTSSCFLLWAREEEKPKEVFCFFESGSPRGSSASGVPFPIDDKR